MISLGSGSCLSKLERVKANSTEAAKIAINNHMLFNILALFAFTRFYLRVLADPNEIIRRLKHNVILRNVIEYVDQGQLIFPKAIRRLSPPLYL